MLVLLCMVALVLISITISNIISTMIGISISTTY